MRRMRTVFIAGATLAVIVFLLRYFERRGTDAIWLPLDRSAWRLTAIGTALGAIPICLILGLARLARYGTVAPGTNWQGVLYTAIGGTLMALLVFRYGSLWLMIGYHFGWNATASGIFGLELSGLDEQVSVFASTQSGPDWLTGGDYGFEASLPAVVIELLVLSVVLFTGRKPGLHSIP